MPSTRLSLVVSRLSKIVTRLKSEKAICSSTRLLVNRQLNRQRAFHIKTLKLWD